MEEPNTSFKCSQKGLLFFIDDPGNPLRILLELRKYRTNLFDDNRDQQMQKWRCSSKLLPAKALRSPKNTTQDIASFLITRHGTIGNGKCQRANMIRNDSVSRIFQVFELASILRCLRHLLNRVKQWRKHIRVIIALLPLQNLRNALEAHAGIHVLGRQRGQALVGVAVVLDE